MRWAFDSGLLGERQMAILGSVGGLWSPARIVAETPWRHDKLRAGGGASIDIGVHQMDVLAPCPGEARTVQALARTFELERFRKDVRVAADVDDTYFATVACDGGAVAQLLWSWAGHGESLEIPVPRPSTAVAAASRAVG